MKARKGSGRAVVPKKGMVTPSTEISEDLALRPTEAPQTSTGRDSSRLTPAATLRVHLQLTDTAMAMLSDEATALRARVAQLEAAIRRWVEARGAYDGKKGQAKWFGDVVLAETALAELLADAGVVGTEETALDRLGRRFGLGGEETR